ncbi:hypothetical protein M2432_004551 [Mycobacterium sp. OTB74]|nr:hypothetical protein [Mycobacterium sp. OTB74]
MANTESVLAREEIVVRCRRRDLTVTMARTANSYLDHGTDDVGPPRSEPQTDHKFDSADLTKEAGR